MADGAIVQQVGPLQAGASYHPTGYITALIQQMVTENRLWSVKPIRGELLKLGLHVSRSTIQKYWRQGHLPNRSGENWSTLMHSQAEAIWACDFIQVTDVLFRSLFAFVIVELDSWRVIHIGVTSHPTDEWVAQQLREATPFSTTYYDIMSNTSTRCDRTRA